MFLFSLIIFIRLSHTIHMPPPHVAIPFPTAETVWELMESAHALRSFAIFAVNFGRNLSMEPYSCFFSRNFVVGLNGRCYVLSVALTYENYQAEQKHSFDSTFRRLPHPRQFLLIEWFKKIFFALSGRRLWPPSPRLVDRKYGCCQKRRRLTGQAAAGKHFWNIRVS